ncbi:hypothetical protein [Fulvivirga sedimenti]|uniref:SH3 domain-containing protein n=1 Tax=Fulvivirga sedimenti TaxID=2879465 RepID=A0A9X1L144_9BACT|nr:hypothetical protein [Fulvivirga sedimenti]MCA6075532.1 hypothetical protein [Fulvivirga sedimenti]MCA6076709.1 hypothetical protein [Fulvivirga sedimenti]MCA6077837.1 hypothetical protein [Fulvivirga sedimenti]
MKRLILLAFLFTWLLSAETVLGQPALLSRADSLFTAGKYTESFGIYDEILTANKQYSPAMLMKMAYIKEGLNQYSEALYYLNLYYLKTADQAVLAKMDELAQARNLRGYSVNDQDIIYTFFYRYYPYMIGALMALAILMLALVYRERFRLNQSGKVPAFFMLAVLAVLFYLLNFGLSYDKGIVNDSTAYLMEGPSAGADVVEVIGKGHRLEINGKKDVWIKTSWDNRPVYIKASKLKPVTF